MAGTRLIIFSKQKDERKKMLSQEIKLVIVGSTILFGGILLANQVSERRNAQLTLQKAEIEHKTQIEKAQLESTYPPEYWLAKKEEVESKERLEKDKRDRADVEKERIREFEKTAPESYWAQKRFEEEEKTRREQMRLDERRRQRLENDERDLTNKRLKMLRDGRDILDSVVRNTGYIRTSLY